MNLQDCCYDTFYTLKAFKLNRKVMEDRRRKEVDRPVVCLVETCVCILLTEDVLLMNYMVWNAYFSHVLSFCFFEHLATKTKNKLYKVKKKKM